MTADVMLIANQLDHYELFYSAGDDVQLGKFIMEQIQRPSDQAREFLDPEKVGAAYRQKGGNTFCDGHFIKVTSLIDPFLDGDPSMNPDKGDFAIRVKLASRTNMDGVWVGFPDTGEHMLRLQLASSLGSVNSYFTPVTVCFAYKIRERSHPWKQRRISVV